MSREFKFRVWDGKAFVSDPRTEIARLLCEPMVMSLASFGKVIQQFTGLKDSKGTDIYEGDIMASRGNYITDERDKDGNYPDIFCVVVYSQKNSRFGFKSIKDYSRNLKFPIKPEFDNCWTAYLTTFKEVIGNIFENPELLKK